MTPEEAFAEADKIRMELWKVLSRKHTASAVLAVSFLLAELIALAAPSADEAGVGAAAFASDLVEDVRRIWNVRWGDPPENYNESLHPRPHSQLLN